MRYKLKESASRPYWWTLADKETGVVIQFEEGNYNDKQEVIDLGIVKNDPMKMASILQEMGEWLREHHYEIIFTSPKRIKENARKLIGETLKALREDTGISTRVLAKMTGLSHNHIIRIEQGKYAVTLDTLALIASAFDMEIDFCDKEGFE